MATTPTASKKQLTEKARLENGAREMFKQITPLGHIGRSEEVAAAILFLASDDSSYSMGINLVADGITQL